MGVVGRCEGGGSDGAGRTTTSCSSFFLSFLSVSVSVSLFLHDAAAGVVKACGMDSLEGVSTTAFHKLLAEVQMEVRRYISELQLTEILACEIPSLQLSAVCWHTGSGQHRTMLEKSHTSSGHCVVESSSRMPSAILPNFPLLFLQSLSKYCVVLYADCMLD